MEPRLTPVNAFVSLCRSGDGWPSVLEKAGYYLARLEVPVKVDGRDTVVFDAVAVRGDGKFILAMEAKSGSNIEQEQACRLTKVEAASVIRSGAIAVRSEVRPVLDVCFFGLWEKGERLKKGLHQEGIDLPLVLIGPDRLALEAGQFRDEELARAFSVPIQVDGPPPAYLRVDERSSDETFRELLRPGIVASMSRRESTVSVRVLAERAVPDLGLMGLRHQQKLLRRFEQAARTLAIELSDSIHLIERTAACPDAVLRILKSPEDSDPRGRTQGYQALARRSTRAPKEAPGQLTIEDLLDELEEGADTDEAGDDVEVPL